EVASERVTPISTRPCARRPLPAFATSELRMATHGVPCGARRCRRLPLLLLSSGRPAAGGPPPAVLWAGRLVCAGGVGGRRAPGHRTAIGRVGGPAFPRGKAATCRGHGWGIACRREAAGREQAAKQAVHL